MSDIAVGTGATSRARGFGTGRHLSLSAFWCGQYFLVIPMLGILVPARVAELATGNAGITASGAVYASGAAIALLAPPIVGAWSDRLVTPWGRRKPLMVGGVAINVVGLLALMVAPSYAGFLAAYLVMQLGLNAAGAAYSALVPDVVPAGEIGRSSGVIGMAAQVGTVTGLACVLVMEKLGQRQASFAVIAAVQVLTLVPTLFAAGSETGRPLAAPHATPPLLARARDFVRPLHNGDFAWVIWTRFLIYGGIWLIYPFLFFFFRDVVAVPHPDSFTTIWQLILALTAIPMGMVGGWLSDRFGRKLFVYLSGAAMGLVVLFFVAVFPNQEWIVFLLGALYGLGYGCYFAVDWALACETLPDRERHAAKDMGLFHVAVTLPQVLFPGLAGPILAALNNQSHNAGYRVVFSGAVLFYIAGTVLVSRVRGVR